MIQLKQCQPELQQTPITNDPNYLAAVAAEINDRPRKIHHWKKPSEVFTELIDQHASTG